MFFMYSCQRQINSLNLIDNKIILSYLGKKDGKSAIFDANQAACSL